MAAADDFAGVSRLPLSSSCLRSPAPIGLCTLLPARVNCKPRPGSNSGPAPTSPPLSRVPGPQPLPARRGPSRISQMYQHKVSKPQRPTPRCSNPRTRQSPKRALERFLEPPFSGRGWALGWGLFLLNKQTFLGKAHFLESSYLCQQPSPAKLRVT